MENVNLNGHHVNATTQPDSNLTPPQLLQNASLSDGYENTAPGAYFNVASDGLFETSKEALDYFTDISRADLAVQCGFKPNHDAQYGGHFVQGPMMANNHISPFGANYVPTGSNLEASLELGYLLKEPRDERDLLYFSPSKNQDMPIDSPGQQIVVHMNVPPTIQNEVYASDKFSSRCCIAKYLSLDPKIADLYYVGEIFKDAQNREIYLSVPIDADKVYLLDGWIAKRREADHLMGFYF